MPSASQHCADCRRELGEPFEHVHEWLDAMFKVLGPKYRSARHHAGGMEQVRKMWATAQTLLPKATLSATAAV